MNKQRKSRSEKRKAKELAIKRQKEKFAKEEGRFDYIRSYGLHSLTTCFQKGKGVSRHEAKKTGEDVNLIHSEKTFRMYCGSWEVFSNWLAKAMTPEETNFLLVSRKQEKQKGKSYWIPWVNKYLQDCINRNLTANTLSSYKSALAKTLGTSSTNFIPTPPRKRRNKKNNRTKETDERLSAQSNEFWKKIVSATGLRVEELRHITGNCLIYNPKHKLWYMKINGKKHNTKGGRNRYSPIMTKNEQELEEILDLFRQAGAKKVFYVPTALRPHKYRAEYAKRVYLNVARPIESINNRKEKVYLRGELKGIVLDRKACQITSRALGHNRPDEFQKSYAYKLLKG